MMTWFDLALASLVLLVTASGFVRGLAKQAFDILGFGAAFFVSLWGGRVISRYLVEYIDPELILSHHEIMQKPGVDVAGDKAPQLVAGIISFLLLFLVLCLAFLVFAKGFRWVNRIPVIGFFNRLGGAAVGAGLGVALAYIFIAAFSLVPTQLFFRAIEQSEAVFLVDHYLALPAERLKEYIFNYYLLPVG